MTPSASFLDTLKLAAESAERAEEAFRREVAARTKSLEQERAFAHRRLNFMRPITEAVASAESEEVAVAAASSVLRAKLGWAEDSEVRTEVLNRFEPVTRAVFASLAPPEKEGGSSADVVGSLKEFEIWYAGTHPNQFWVLFETYLPETPRVDF